MDGFFFAVGSAIWLGILTSISPCPLATNIAAISFVSKRVTRPLHVLFAGLLYTLGRTLSYFLVALLVVQSLLSSSAMSMFLQQNASRIIGPLLLLVGLLLLDIIPWPWAGKSSALWERLQARIGNTGLWGAGLLGIVFALAFCPVSAALFFGGLLPLAVEQQSAVLLPSLYGIGTALPVVVFALILAFAAHRLAKAFNALTLIERWMRRITAIVFIVVGVYYLFF